LETLASALTDGLQRHDPTIGANVVGMPEQAPEGVFTNFSGGTIISAQLAADPGTLFSGTMGFEFAPSNASFIKQTDAWQEFVRLVSQHDADGVDEIVISAEAPTTDGFAYPSDAALAQSVVEHGASTPLTTRHVKQVYLHVWSTSGVFKFIPGTPGVQTVCGDLPLSAT
jgi:hypothetical protein